MPSPADIPSVSGHDANDKPVVRHASDDEPFSALAFKIMTDPFVGHLTFFRVYSGVMRSGDSVYNAIKGKKARVGRLLQMHAHHRSELTEVAAGNITAAGGLNTRTKGED